MAHKFHIVPKYDYICFMYSTYPMWILILVLWLAQRHCLFLGVFSVVVLHVCFVFKRIFKLFNFLLYYRTNKTTHNLNPTTTVQE